MTENKMNQVILSDEERKFLDLCLKSKTILQLKRQTLKAKFLDKLARIFATKK